MNIVRLDLNARKTERKPSKRQQEREKAVEWVMKQRAIDSKKSLKILASEISEIRKINPDFMVAKTARL